MSQSGKVIDVRKKSINLAGVWKAGAEKEDMSGEQATEMKTEGKQA